MDLMHSRTRLSESGASLSIVTSFLRWEALMRTFSKNNEPIWFEVSSPYTLFVTRDTYLTLRAARLMPEQDELIDILADDATLTRYDGGFSWTDTSKTVSILLEQVRFAKVRARKTS